MITGRLPADPDLSTGFVGSIDQARDHALHAGILLVEDLGKDLRIPIDAQNKPQRKDMDLWLLFAPVKRSGTDMIVQKATELGVSRLQPVMTRRTIAERIKLDRMAIIAREAAEQSGRISVPEVAEPRDLARLLKDWPAERRLFFCDERGDGPSVARACLGVNTLVPGPWAILIGPEINSLSNPPLKARGSGKALSINPKRRVIKLKAVT